MPLLNAPRLEPTVFLYSDRVDDLARFYVQTPGFGIRRSEAGHSYWLDTSAVTLVLHQSERAYVDGPYEPAEDSTLLWFHVAQPIQTVYDKVRQARIEVAGDVERQLRAGLLIIRDLEGRRLGLIGTTSRHHKR